MFWISTLLGIDIITFLHPGYSAIVVLYSALLFSIPQFVKGIYSSYQER